MEESIEAFKREVIQILKDSNEDIDLFLPLITRDSIMYAINNNYSPQIYVGGLLF